MIKSFSNIICLSVFVATSCFAADRDSIQEIIQKNIPKVSYASDYERFRKMIPEYDQDTFENLFIDRSGETENSNMTALGLHIAVRNNKAYQITLDGIKEVKYARPRVLEKRTGVYTTAPKHVEIEAVWDKNAAISGDENNIFGDNVQLVLGAESITIPVVTATEDALGYYGATFVNMGEIVQFPDKVFPIWAMNLGENYVDGFIMTEAGGGMYLEYHHDAPHFHMPLTDDTNGYYILAKKVGVVNEESQKFKFQLTAFRIPYGKAVYTYKGSIHSDAALTGTAWLVGYTVTGDYSTAVARTEGGKMAEFHFLKE